jgi:TRAP-type C4-dicarboxylate transport system substrate-binding protein
MSMTLFCRRRVRHAAFVLGFAAAIVAAPLPYAQDRSSTLPELKLSTAQSPAFPLGRAGERWAQLVNEAAGGAFEVRQYPGATLSLRDPGREFGALKDGQADLAVGSALTWSGQFPPLGVYALPWIAADAREQSALAADASLREAVFARMDASGVVGLAIAPLGEHVLATAKAAIATPSACSGLRVRVLPLRQVIDVYAALGAVPQAMGFAQAQAALAAGTLDGQDAMPTTLVATRAFASGQKFVTRWGAFGDVMVFAVRKAAWDSWTDAQRVLVRGAAARAAQEANAPAAEDAALGQLTKDGVTIVRLAPSQRAAFLDAAQPAVAAWESAVGADLVSAARAAAAVAAK